MKRRRQAGGSWRVGPPPKFLKAEAAKSERPRGEPRPLDGKGGAGYPPQPLFASSRLLECLTVEREIETLALDLLRHPQAYKDVDDLEDDQSHDDVVDEHGADADRLVDGLHPIALEQARGATVLTDRKHAGQQRAGGSADRMHPERVERVVVAEHVLEAGPS